MVDNIETVIYTLNYVIPGYIILKIISTITPTTKQSEAEIIVQSEGRKAFARKNGSMYYFDLLVWNQINYLKEKNGYCSFV